MQKVVCEERKPKSTETRCASATPLADKSNHQFFSPKSALKTSKTRVMQSQTPEAERSVHFDQQVQVSVFNLEEEVSDSKENSVPEANVRNVGKGKRAPSEATTPARIALSNPLAPSLKHTSYARGTVSPRAKSRKKVALAIDMCLAASSQHGPCMEALAKIEASNRRPLLLLRDNESGGAPAFRGLYIQTGDNESELSRVFGSGPESFPLKDATR